MNNQMALLGQVAGLKLVQHWPVSLRLPRSMMMTASIFTLSIAIGSCFIAAILHKYTGYLMKFVHLELLLQVNDWHFYCLSIWMRLSTQHRAM